MPTTTSRVELNDPQAYRSKLFKLLGERDPLEVLAETPKILERILREHSAETLRRRPFEGKWTPNEIIGHLADTEWTYGYRIRTILCDEQPTIVGMDQEKWVSRQSHNDREPAELLEAFRTLRRLNLQLWRRMSPSDLQRLGRHSERGPESLELMLRMEAGHDLSHIDQLTRYLAALEKG